MLRNIRTVYPNELCHFGIKGQKWGVRRYQNPDGSLTSEGRLRYSKHLKDDLRARIEKEQKENKGKMSARSSALKTLSDIEADWKTQQTEEMVEAMRDISILNAKRRIRAQREKMIETQRINAVLEQLGAEYKFKEDKRVKTVNVT